VDLPAGRGLRRARRRNRRADRIEAKGLGYARTVRKGFLKVAGMRSAGRCRVIDGSRSPGEVAADVWREVGRVL
jgi:thymidylate kinase